MSDEGEVILDQTGRVLGPRAQTTRQRLLDATTGLLDEKSLRDLRVADIARQVGTSPAAFYQYFKDVEDAVLCLAGQASNEMPSILEHLDGDWRGEAGLERARRIASAFIDHWDQHRAVLRIRNTASDEGDARFQAVRSEAMQPVLMGLAAQVKRNRGDKPATGEHPLAAAAGLAAILERLAAYRRELERFGVTRDDLVETSARIVHRTVTG
ncbi:MAG: TetR/AcrR family transcriptional regulator [Deltaproteobacteria bacterium]|jgi:AcrR family transcriptional regulator|nr:TetR/AcrR family transcriptional regulator [Deltaproteobacteria bacterium]MBW2384891.1 TetR/AcrR family transcriptional regulator [Deltaproteobacteria bacterium]MBW2697409.1 TetR/AcrR family transcriptional regulator [Deltaproteobacteria bacterium]